MPGLSSVILVHPCHLLSCNQQPTRLIYLIYPHCSGLDGLVRYSWQVEWLYEEGRQMNNDVMSMQQH